MDIVCYVLTCSISYTMMIEHDVHQLPNGYWLLWDNGDVRPEGTWSRGAEYTFDVESKKISLVWEYKVGGKNLF